MRNTLIPWAITLTIIAMLAGGCAGSLEFERAGEKVHVHFNLRPPTTDETATAIMPSQEL